MNNLKTYLTEAYAIDNKSILRILTQNKQINKADPDYQYYEKLANWANENGRQQKLKNIQMNTIKLSDRGLLTKNKLISHYTTLGHLLNALKNLMDQEGKYNPASKLSKLIQLTTLEILASLSGFKNDNPEDDKEDNEDQEEAPADGKEEEPKEEPKTTGGKKDWTAYRAKKLANPNGKTTSEILDEFYEEYYRDEYAKGDANIIVKLKSLNKILIPEFNALGYNPEVNPFAAFLKILIEKKPEIFNKLNYNNYGAIHNAFINKSITGNMLGNYNADNLLFCNDLYSQNGLDIVEYFSLQSQVKNNAKKDDKYSVIDKFTARVFIQQKTFNDSYEENVKQLLEANEDAIISVDAEGAKVKTLLEIRELYKHLFKEAAKKQVNVDEIVERAKIKGVLLSMIQHIIDQDDFEKFNSKIVDESEKWLNGQNYVYNKQNIKIARTILSEYTINTTVAKTLITKLQAAYINKEKEAK